MIINWQKNLWIVWTAQICSLAGFHFALPFLPYFIQELGVTDSAKVKLWTGIMSSAPAVTMAIMAPVWGILADRIGKKMMLLRAMFCGTFILAGLSLAGSVTVVVTLRLLQGLLSGTMTASAALISSGTPRKKLSYALGMLSSSNFIGMSLGPLVGGVTAEYFGYRISFLIGAFIHLTGFLLVLFAVRENRENPEGVEEEKTETPNDSGRVPLFNFTIIGGLCILLVLRLSRNLPIPFIPLYVQEFLGTMEGASTMTGVISFGRGAMTALASVTIVRMGDRINRMKLITLLLGITAVLSIPVPFAADLAGFSFFLILSTFFLGGIEPLVQSEIISTVPPRKRGLIFGIQTTVSNIGWSAAPMIGSLISIKLGISMVFLAMVAFMTLSTLISFFFAVLQKRLVLPAETGF